MRSSTFYANGSMGRYRERVGPGVEALRWSGLVLLVATLVACGAPVAPGLDVEDTEGVYALVVASEDVAAMPLDGAIVFGSIGVRLNATYGVDRVEYAFDWIGTATVPVAPVLVTAAPFLRSLDTTRLPDGEHVLVATVHRSDGTTMSVRARFQVDNGRCRPLPGSSVWSTADVGSVSTGGTTVACEGGQRLVVWGAGSDVWGTNDAFRFVYQVLEGDGTITARVDSVDAVDEWSKFGVMVREDLDSDARNAMLLLTEENGVLFQRRDERGGSTNDVLPDGRYLRDATVGAPHWLRIERTGTWLTASHSVDGTAWQELGSVQLELSESVFVGLAVSARDATGEAMAVFLNASAERMAVIEEPQPEPKPDPDPDPDPEPEPDPEPAPGPLVRSTFSASAENIANPERGWYTSGNPGNYAYAAATGHTLVMRYVRLDDYRYSTLPQSFLDQLHADLSGLRHHGLKVILRFSYNFGFTADAPLDRVLQHIRQLAPVLQAHADVIAVLQAGFIGAWGEWHSSTNGLLTLANRTLIADALLAAMDASRMIQIRTPYHARDIFGLPSAATAFNGSASSRVGQVNDCFLTNASDAGTFLSAADWSYAEAVSRYTVQGGETCEVGGSNARNDGANAVAEMARFHYDYLNHDYWRTIVDKWRSQGHYSEISRRLGYRFVLEEAAAVVATAPGRVLDVTLRVANVGFGKLYNPRPVYVVLRPVGGGSAVVLHAMQDVRTALPLAGETRDVNLRVNLPSVLPVGGYDIFVGLPDSAPTLAGDPRYALRFANEGTWDATTGLNSLNLRVEVGSP